jgi:short subunit dehydrogenase-like uncharacterized protein
MDYLLYGANGYTAQLIIKESLKAGLTPTLAGRSENKVMAIASEYNLDFKIFDLENTDLLSSNLQGFDLVLNAAGPFSKTALPLAKACIASKIHYLDITGEIEVFETLKTLGSKSKEAGIMLMPGTGFDVVPSDCLANYLKEKLPTATHLEMGFTSVGGGISHGTATTMAQHLGEGGVVRENGKLKQVKIAHKSQKIDFGSFTRSMATIPWGDISTAYTSTGIPNIEIYTSIPAKTIKKLKYQSFFNPLLKTKIVRKLAQKWIDKNLYGPTEEQNTNGKSYIYGSVSVDNKNNKAILTCAEGYLLTALTSVNIATKILNKQFTPGYQTPATAYGWRLILEIPGSEINDI